MQCSVAKVDYKITFFKGRKKVPMAAKPEGGGVKGLSGLATKKRTFFVASLRCSLNKKYLYIFVLRYDS